MTACRLALSGLSSLLLDPDDPRMSGPTIADNITGMYAAQGILGALLRRTGTGTGGHVEVNMLEAAISFMPDAFAQYSRAGIVSGPETRVRISQAYTLRAQDGLLVTVHFSSVQKFWEGLLKAIERPDLAGDERFATPVARTETLSRAARNPPGRFRRPPPRRMGRTHWRQKACPAVRSTGWTKWRTIRKSATLAPFARTIHPDMGEVIGIKSPIRLDGARRDNPPPPPVLNADAEAIAAEFGFEE